MKQYFRKDYCVYLTKTMFRYLNILSETLTEQISKGDVSIYVIASVSALIRLVQTNLRCLVTCKVDLDQLISKEECQNFEQMRIKFNSTFSKSLKSAVQAKALDEVKVAEANEKAKELKEKEKEAKAKAKEAEEEAAKKVEAEKQTTKIDTTDAKKTADSSEADKDSKEKKEEKKKTEESDAEEDESPTKEQTEEIWKKADRYVVLVTKQARELENVLNKIFNSKNPASQMKGLSESLKKASSSNDKAALQNCFSIFDAVQDDKKMREILRGSKEESESCTEVVKQCLDLTYAQ